MGKARDGGARARIQCQEGLLKSSGAHEPPESLVKTGFSLGGSRAWDSAVETGAQGGAHAARPQTALRAANADSSERVAPPSLYLILKLPSRAL